MVTDPTPAPPLEGRGVPWSIGHPPTQNLVGPAGSLCHGQNTPRTGCLPRSASQRKAHGQPTKKPPQILTICGGRFISATREAAVNRHEGRDPLAIRGRIHYMRHMTAIQLRLSPWYAVGGIASQLGRCELANHVPRCLAWPPTILHRAPLPVGLCAKLLVHVGSGTATVAHGKNDGGATAHDVASREEAFARALHAFVHGNGVLPSQFQTFY